MSKALPYIFFAVLVGALLFMGIYMNKLADLGKTTSATQGNQP